MEYTIYKIIYETMVRANMNAIVSASSRETSKSLLEKYVCPNKEEISFKIWEVKKTEFKSDKEGVIYAELNHRY